MTLDTALKLAPLVGALLVALARAVPADFWVRNPRLGQLARFCRAAFPDVVKAGRALAAALRKPAPDNVVHLPPRHPRNGESP
jgi:hypothetical protein